MRNYCTGFMLLVGSLLVCGGLPIFMSNSRSVAADGPVALAGPPNADVWKDLQYENATSCVRCHVQPGGNDLPPRDPTNMKPYALQSVLLTEYAIWKTHDKH